VIAGLIGSPANEGVNVNINGTHRLAAAGDVTVVPVDETTTCRVTIQSFDMFKALLHATCAAKAK
jgi:hypothetical protein